MKILNWKNCLILSFITYALYTLLWFAIDPSLWDINDASTYIAIAIDFVSCILFTAFSLFYSYLTFKLLPLHAKPYNRMIIYACILFLLNNVGAWLMSSLFNFFYEIPANDPFRFKGMYAYGMIATFVSCVYANALYLESYIKTQNEKQKLEMDLIREKEIGLQSQLNSLKAQIDPHFMFNNFSILSGLIEENVTLADEFLSNLSKVYRYIIQNLERNTIHLSEEIKFLNSYLYLIKIRYGEAVVVIIQDELNTAEGYIPPASLQLLVENAIKHNGHSNAHPLYINILRINEYVTVNNLISPLLSPIESTGIGLKNIKERYSFLSDKNITVNKTEKYYSVSLPILKH